jgi:hypothetical protein
MSSLSNTNPYQYITRCISSVVVYWSRTQDQILLKCKYFFLSCSHHVVILHNTKNYYTNVLYFLNTFNHHCMALLQVALVSTPPHKFVRPPCWYYQLWEIGMYDFRVIPNCITSIPNFIQIHPAVLKLKHEDRDKQTDITSPICIHFMRIMQRMHNKVAKFY